MARQESIPMTAISAFRFCVTQSLTYLDKDSVLVFVCGGQPNAKNPNARDRFMEYAKRHLSGFQFFMAERFFEAFQNPDRINLLRLENKLTEFSDCVIIFLESAGAFTELGAFANRDDIARILLAVNDIQFKNTKSPSFITAGPIAELDRKSKFRPAIYANFKSVLTASSHIEDRLRRIERKKGKRVDLATFEGFTALPSKVRMLFLMDLVSIFNPINHQEIISILTEFYGENRFEIALEMSMLRALGLLEQIDGWYLSALSKHTLFFRFLGFDSKTLRASVINHYHKHVPKKTAVLRAKLGLDK